jgi:DeoR/GlpR family transcriptional regulator of sugar metabolism
MKFFLPPLTLETATAKVRKHRSGFMTEEKTKIGRTAASLIRPGESVFIDGGTTTQQIVRFLPSEIPITVVKRVHVVLKTHLDI